MEVLRELFILTFENYQNVKVLPRKLIFLPFRKPRFIVRLAAMLKGMGMWSLSG